MNENDFLKLRIAIIPGTSYTKPEYLEDDGKLIKIFLI
jgi:ubiquitin carboxyl-terminal hydrolase 7